MELDDETRSRIEEAIADVYFRSIDEDELYVVISDGAAAGQWTMDRLVVGKVATVVGHRDDPAGRIIRQCGIYRICDVPSLHGDISRDDALDLVTAGVGVLFYGDDITVGHLHDAADREVEARLLGE